MPNEHFNISNVSIDEMSIDEKINNESAKITEDELLFNISAMLKRARVLVVMTRNSSNILNFIRCKQNDNMINFQLLKDFKIRWNYTYLFLDRVSKYKDIILELTGNPTVIPGIQPSQVTKLKRLSFSDFEWTLINALIEVLAPFYYATKMLSGRTYQTQSISYAVLNGLKSYLNTKMSDDNDDVNSDVEEASKSTNINMDEFYNICNILKGILLKNFDHYKAKHISTAQNEAILVN